jgi:hypothetical protein
VASFFFDEDDMSRGTALALKMMHEKRSQAETEALSPKPSAWDMRYHEGRADAIEDLLRALDVAVDPWAPRPDSRIVLSADLGAWSGVGSVAEAIGAKP